MTSSDREPAFTCGPRRLVESNLRIRLPNDYVLNADLVRGGVDALRYTYTTVYKDVAPLKMEDIVNQSVQMMAGSVARDLMVENTLLYSCDLAKPLTFRQRWSRRWQRVKDAWDVLRGAKDVDYA